MTHLKLDRFFDERLPQSAYGLLRNDNLKMVLQDKPLAMKNKGKVL